MIENLRKLLRERNGIFAVFFRSGALHCAVKLFYTGPLINAEMLVVMLEKHGIAATQEFADSSLPDDGDLNRPTKILVPERHFDRAWQLFYAEREDEL